MRWRLLPAMPRFLAQVREEERHETLWAAITVFLVLVAHAMLETARDALFLSHLPASRLPWVYLALAALALLATRALGRSPGPPGDLRQLIALQIVAAAGTLAMLIVLIVMPAKPAWALYALYLWGGLASTLILIRFWMLLTDRFTIGQARRLFPLLAAGPLFGSLVGYGLAGVLCRFMPPGDLLGVSAAVFLLSAGGSLVLRRSRGEVAEKSGARRDTSAATIADRAAPETLSLRQSVALALRHPYVRRVAFLLLMASVTVTLGDFIFKSVVAREIEPAHLGSFLAMSYFLFDLLALALLFTVVVPFVRSRGVSDALALQPALLLCSGVLLTIVGGLASVLCLRGVDGALRWSLHKTATELLYVPLSPRLRGAVKAVSDIVAHRGGQALASLLILTWLALTPSEKTMGPVLVTCAGLWVYLAVSLRQPYLDLFRDTLSRGAIETRLEFPDLDLASLETLIAALSSPDERKVLAALYLLEQTERVHLVPALILYHPSSAVVLRALELFTAAGRDDVLPVAEHLFRHPETAVRAATMRACVVLQPQIEMLQRASESESPSIAATAIVALAGKGALDPGEAATRLEPFLVAEGAEADEVRRVLARALRDHPLPAFASLLVRLAAAGDVATRREAALAMGATRDERHLPVLVGLLGTRELREAMREALLDFGEVALVHLQQALVDPSLPRAVRLHVPRTISRFPSATAAEVLVRHLPLEASGAVRYKILRGLGHLVANHPQLQLDPEVLEEVIEGQLRAIFQGLHWQVVLQQGVEEKPERGTTGHELLVELLQQKQTLATERLFRILGLRFRDEDLEKIHAGLQSPDAKTRSSSRELLQGVLPAALRQAVLALTEELPNPERLAAAGESYQNEPIEYEPLLMTLAGERSVSVSCIASYHAGELGLCPACEPVEEAAIDRNPWLTALRQGPFDPRGSGAAAARRNSA